MVADPDNIVKINMRKKKLSVYRPQKVRPKNLTIGGRYFYG